MTSDSPLWYLRFTASDSPFGILDLRLLISPLWYLRLTASDYPRVIRIRKSKIPKGVIRIRIDLRILITPFGILDLRILITPLWYLRFTDSDYPFGILDIRILIAPFGILDLRILINPLVS
jgi:hypothetical protein